MTETPARLPLRERLSFLARDTVVYGGAAALSAASSLITFPLLARHFEVAEYGLIDLFNTISVLLAISIVFGQDSGVARYFYDDERAEQRRQLISQSLTLQLGLALLALPLIWLGAGALAERLSPAPEAPLLMRLVLLTVPFQVLANFSQNLLKWTFARRGFLLVSIGSTLARIAVLCIAVLGLDVGVVGVFVATAAVQVVFGLLGVWLIRDWLTWPRGVDRLRTLMPFSAPYGMICALGAFVPVAERMLVSELLGPREIGIYAAGAKVALLLSLPVQAFQMAWGPFSLAIHKSPDATATYRWVAKGFTLGVCAVALGLSWAAEPLIRILASDRYAGASVVVFPLAAGLAIQAVSWITGVGIGLSKQSRLSLYAYAVFLATAGASMLVLGRQFGITGIAAGLMLGQLVRAVVETLLAQRVYPIDWPLVRLALLIAYTLAAGLLGDTLHATLGAGARFAALGVALALLLPLGWWLLFDAGERRQLTALVRRLASA